MKITQQVFGFVAMSLICAGVARGQSTKFTYEAGVGGETFRGSFNNDGGLMRAVTTIGAAMSWTAPNPSLQLSVGTRAELHPLGISFPGSGCSGPTTAPIIGAPQSQSAATYCARVLPTFYGGQLTGSVEYSLTSRLAAGVGVGAGYLESMSSENGLGGSRIQSARANVSFVMSEHATLVGQVERDDMPNFQGMYVRAMPVSLMMRFR